MSDQSADQTDQYFSQLLAIVNEQQEEVEELTEEELQQALSSPSLHQNALECNDEDSTECDDYDNTDPNSSANAIDAQTGDQTGDRRNEYQFQMMDHHIFKGKHGKKLYKCDVCFAVYRHSFSLKRHFIRSHINYGYLCETDVTNCGINLTSSASLQSWTNQRKADELVGASGGMTQLYCCHSCVLFFDQLSLVKSHVDERHRNTKSGNIEPIRIPCAHCNMSFIQRHNLMRHIEVVHQGRKLYGCKHCGKKFQTIADRKRHEKSLHPSKQHSDQQIPNKTHACIRCSDIFYTYSNLRKHVNKKHSECYNPCGFCTKFAFNKKQLSEHLRTRHGKSIKDNREKLKLKKQLPIDAQPPKVNAKSTVANNTSIAATNVSQLQQQQQQFQNTQQAYFHCTLCYRRFLTYGSLIRHKQIAHRPQVRNCSRLRSEPLEEKEIISPFKDSTEIEFYRTLAQRVAENLLYFVDGKFINCRNNSDEVIPFVDKSDAARDKANAKINLTDYNFPADYNQCLPPTTPSNTEKLEFLHDCDLHTTVQPNSIAINASNIDDLSSSSQSSSDKTTFICSVCEQRISPESFAEHEANNHPNVYCTFIEVDSYRTIPSQLLLWHYHKPDGLLHQCAVPPSHVTAQDNDSALSLKCTKCTKSFASVSLLHHHILECAHNSSKRKSHNNNNLVHDNNNNNHKSNNYNNNCNNSSLNNLFVTSEDDLRDFSSPLSPCKTRSGKRRQTSIIDVKRISKKLKPVAKPDKNEYKQKTVIQPEVSEIPVCSTHDIDDNNNDDKSGEEPKEQSQVITEQLISEEQQQSVAKDIKTVPKRYFCKKCTKKFVYMDSLKKHQLSCKLVVYKSKQTAKEKKLRINSTINKKLALKIELKAYKSILNQKKDIQKSITTKRTKRLTRQFCINDKKVGNNSKAKSIQKQVLSESLKPTVDDEDSNESETKTIIIDNVCSSISSATPPNSRPQSSGDEIVNTTNNNNCSETVGVHESDNIAANTSVISPLQEHRCPDCLRVFTYMANFRKHIKNVCPVRKQLGHDSVCSTPSISAPPVAVLSPTEQTPANSINNLVIKQEVAETDDSLNNNNNSTKGSSDEVIIECEKPLEKQVEDEDDVVPKDESKLDLWRVKQENPMYAFKGSPAQHHSCPYCQRGFTYLANYRKHIKSICPIRQQIEEKKKQVMEDSQETDGRKVKSELPSVVYTPTSLSVRSQIEDTVLTLLRDQTKQDQILQSSEEMVKAAKAEDSISITSSSSDTNNTNISNNSVVEIDSKTDCETESKTKENDASKLTKKEGSLLSLTTPGKGSSYRFRTFSCSICHKIFLSYVTMLKHRLSHKLTDGTVNEENNNIALANISSDKLIQVNHDKETQNQELAASLLKKSKDTILNKMRNSVTNSMKLTTITKQINTTELLEKLARGGISSESIAINNNITAQSNENVQQLSSNASNNNGNSDANQTSNNTASTSNLQEIIIEANNLEDFDMNALKDSGIIVSPESLHQLIVDNVDGVTSKVPVNEVLLDIDPNEIGSTNELWITFTESSAFVQVPDSTSVSNANASPLVSE